MIDRPPLFAFGNDGGTRQSGIGPVRWMAPESLRTTHYVPFTPGATAPGQWSIAAFSYFDASYPVPEPAAVAMLLVGIAGCLRRSNRQP